MSVVCLLLLSILAAGGRSEPPDKCVECHLKVTPGVVSEWRASRHSAAGATCATCHGSAHGSATDAAKAAPPTPDLCARCHATQVAQFKKGKHALAWSALEALPTFHWQPMTAVEGPKGCQSCHRIGLKSDEEARDLARQGHGFGAASCDACHTSHLFSLKEARQPQACQGCHAGTGQAEWEAYAGSKHGVRALLKQSGVLPASASAPTCQTCHMQGGSHEVRTAWGSLGMRLPLPPEYEWAGDRGVLLQSLGIADVDGGATERFDAMEEADMLRRDEAGWRKERDAMLAVCRGCHTTNFAQAELEKGDRMIRESDRLMSQGLAAVAQLYRSGALRMPPREGNAFPDLLTFQAADTPVEQRLYRMFTEHRMNAFKGAFHGNPDYALWHGWNAMKQDLIEINALGDALQQRPVAQPSPPPPGP